MCAGSLVENSKDAPDAMIEFREGVELLKNEYPEKALPKLKAAFEKDKQNPYFISFLGLATARAEQDWDRASELCETAVQLKRKEIQFHLNLIEVFALAGLRERALHKLQVASSLFGNDSRLRRARSRLEERRAPILPFFGRKHFLNRELGKLRHRILHKRNK
jgi:tetratricopeptide (TPR) repeat protein